MKANLIVSLRMTLFLVVLTGGIYPLLVYFVAQVAFNRQANGSMIERNGRVVGSELIGQAATSDRLFHPRPSASDYDPMSSGGTNLGPTSSKLRNAVATAIDHFDTHTDVPADAVTSSGSGLDPHISPENARAQVARVARANGLSVARVSRLVEGRIEGRFAGVFGEPRVNVLQLNVSLLEQRP